MRKRTALLVLILLGPAGRAQDLLPTPDPVPDTISENQIRMPVLPAPVGPPLPPTPQPVTEIAEDTWYVIDSEVPLIVLASRVGFVSVTEDEGPMKIRGKFSDGSGKVETRTYQGKHIYTVEVVARGQVELLVVPRGVQEESQILRRTLSVVGPRPPPDPIVDPPVPPGPDIDPVPVTGFRVLFLTDENADSAAVATINSTPVLNWLDENCAKGADGRAEWRSWDRTTVSRPNALDREDPVWQDLWKGIQSKLIPGSMVIITTDSEFSVHPLKGPTETLALLKKIKEGK